MSRTDDQRFADIYVVGAELASVVPAEIRRTLSIPAGDIVRFVIDADGVRIVTARFMSDLLWANNAEGDDGDCANDVREFGYRDRRHSDATFERIFGTPVDGRSEDEISADLLAALRLE